MTPGGYPDPQADPPRTHLAEACTCGGTIRVEMRQDYNPARAEGAIMAAIQAHQRTDRHQAYLDGRKYLPS